MMLFFTGALLLSLVSTSAAIANVPPGLDNAIPKYPYDEKTTKWCTWWLDSDGSLGCQDVENVYGVSVTDFLTWNPSAAASCSKIPSGASYCLAAAIVPRPKPSQTSTAVVQPSTTTISVTVSAPTVPPSPPHTTTVSVTISLTTLITTTAVPSVVTSVVTIPQPKPSSTRPSNGVKTPGPYQDGMVDNCSTFYFTRKGDTCGVISAANGISLQDFVSWNPGVGGPNCPTLWADAYVCVNILGRPPTRTKVSNGVNTPAPIQDGMTSSCKNFYFVVLGDTCEGIASKYGISVEQIVEWNPAARPDCSGLWAESYCCVGTL